MKATGHWMNSTFVVDGSVVGTVQQSAGGEWFAYGCLSDWEDTPLRSFPTQAKAKKAVENWANKAAAMPPPKEYNSPGDRQRFGE